MTTLTKDISLTIPNDISTFLHYKAEQRGVSISNTILALIAEAMEFEEDAYFAELAAKREAASNKLIPFNEVNWN